MNNSAKLSRLPELFSPSAPINKFEALHGRQEQLEGIESAFRSRGRHVFIYGDQGVGKTSLAQTAAFRVHGSPILLACEKVTTLDSLVQDILNHVEPEAMEKTGRSRETGGGVGVGGTGVEHKETSQYHARARSGSMNEIIATLNAACEKCKHPPLIIIDEFNRLSDHDEQARIGDFIKQCSDQRVPIRLLFVGVGRSLSELMHGHESAYRYLSQITLPRLNWDARMEIIHHAERELGIHVDKHYAFRIASISDGFPHYVHLLGEKLFEQMLLHGDGEKVTGRIYDRALDLAVKDVEHYLSEIYRLATEKYDDVYQEILWALADSPTLRRRSSDIFASYQRIAAERKREPLTRDQFNRRLNRLKSASHGKIVEGSRSGWYEFTEPMVRGYVRLCAERAGVELDIEHGLSPGRGS